MASTQIFFNYPTYTKNFNMYEYCDDGYSDDSYSDYEDEIEYSLQQQDKLEQCISGNSGRSSGGVGSSSANKNNNTSSSNNSGNVSQTKSTPLLKNTNGKLSSNNQIKSVDQILEELEKQENKHIKHNVEKAVKLSSTEKEEILKRETENIKKERLPSSEEVYNRIKWEFNSKVENFTIYYEDRFDGLVSSSFKEFEYDVIPHHRIQMFKYKDTVIYSRKERIYSFDAAYN
ncbi:hypothetical protein DICPUDRAFT_76844 [Dictyostelium purpureum]|uniref:MJ1316 RNA cyclic group end recognition domain-containing protein n=1 Tax=Dictyostelium purpureum TaxID=5786 RepID=F0ZET6_DICPU|nr:uncharacterized protein DICPUDRAFT_76844 [Dictyostelium purpureum]EGC37529.1 hypothetical protein DICPUDRAFT_76844 [Dictyostelium purpureum]|eukprot:XP_003285920.1 hypothetical protein DICPUDRAFT_76844 [Dictyostelium purpureum]